MKKALFVLSVVFLTFPAFAQSTLYSNSTTGQVGIGTSAPDALLSLDGQSARTVDMIRETTASAAGNNLTVQAGGAFVGGTNLNGGALNLTSGISTGNGSSGINFNIYNAGSSGSSDNSPTTALALTGAGLNLSSGVYEVGGTQIAASNLLNGVTGSGSTVLAISPTLTTPNIGAATGTSLAVTGNITTSGGQVGVGTTTPNSSLDLSQKTDAIALPVGTTGQRPTGANGMIRFNSSTPGVEAYYGGVWNALSSSSSGAFQSVTLQTFASGGTYTPTSGMQYCIVKMIGGGGGGNGYGGGGTGEYAEGVFSAATIGVSQTITIGSGGSANSNGGTTSIGTLMTAVGGDASSSGVSNTNASNGQGGLGGTGGTGSGTLHFPGEPGMGNGYARYNFIFAQGGNGGSSRYGAGGVGSVGTSDANHITAANASGYGAGGGGDNAGGSGGTGSSGYVEIIEFLNQ